MTTPATPPIPLINNASVRKIFMIWLWWATDAPKGETGAARRTALQKLTVFLRNRRDAGQLAQGIFLDQHGTAIAGGKPLAGEHLLG